VDITKTPRATVSTALAGLLLAALPSPSAA
jgi:hypothetical protein